MYLCLLRMLLAALAVAARAEESLDYTWVAKGDHAVGCIETVRVQKKPIPGCMDLPFAVLDCATYESNYVISDLSACKNKLPVTTLWLKDEKPPQCCEFSKAAPDAKEKTPRLLIDHVDPHECGHRWVSEAGGCGFTEQGHYLFNPLTKMGLDQLVPEIMNLADGDAIPEEVYQKYDSRKIGMTLVYRKYVKDEKDKSDSLKGEKTFDYEDNTDIQIAFRAELVDSIRQKGFLNQHQIQSSKGCLCPHDRAKVEDRIFGVKIEKDYHFQPENPANKVRPKYSFLGFQKIKPDDSPMRDMAHQYGDVIAVLNPEVKDRSTFTMGDSLNSDYENRELGTKDIFHSFRYRSKDNPADLDKKKTWRGHYTEAQIYGKLTMDDVHYFMVNCFSLDSVSKEYIDQLKATGRPVYSCKTTKMDGAIVKVAKGDPL